MSVFCSALANMLSNQALSSPSVGSSFSPANDSVSSPGAISCSHSGISASLEVNSSTISSICSSSGASSATSPLAVCQPAACIQSGNSSSDFFTSSSEAISSGLVSISISPQSFSTVPSSAGVTSGCCSWVSTNVNQSGRVSSSFVCSSCTPAT